MLNEGQEKIIDIRGISMQIRIRRNLSMKNNINRNTLPVRIVLPVVSAEKSDTFIRLANKTRLSKDTLKKCANTLSNFNYTK